MTSAGRPAHPATGCAHQLPAPGATAWPLRAHHPAPKPTASAKLAPTRLAAAPSSPTRTPSCTPAPRITLTPAPPARAAVNAGMVARIGGLQHAKRCNHGQLDSGETTTGGPDGT